MFGLKKRNGIDAIAFFSDKNGRSSVDENFIIRRKNFKVKVRMFNQDTYYYLEHFLTATDIAINVSKLYSVNRKSFYDYLMNGLFRVEDESIVIYKINNFDWVFFRYGRRLRREAKKMHPNFDIEEILDRRAGIKQ